MSGKNKSNLVSNVTTTTETTNKQRGKTKQNTTHTTPWVVNLKICSKNFHVLIKTVEHTK